jgi:hypothetical protein
MKTSMVKIAAMLLVMAPATSEAARAWLLPSQTIVARSGGWITVDAAMADDLFSFNGALMHCQCRVPRKTSRAAKSGEGQDARS